MRLVWTEEALLDLEEILFYYHINASAETAQSIEQRIVSQIEKLTDFTLRVRASTRITQARELVIHNLPYIAFVRVLSAEIQVLNIVHTSRQFPCN